MSGFPDWVRSAAEHLAAKDNREAVLVGFDGFLDSIIHVVDERQSATEFTRIDRMADLGKRISDAAGKSTNIELVVDHVKLGGNGPIFANALSQFGHQLSYIGAIGGAAETAEGSVHPVFQDFASRCHRVVPLAPPAATDALEFNDGKVMLGKMSPLNDVSFDSLLKRLPREELVAMLKETGLVGFVNWTMLPYMNSLFEGFADCFAELEARPYVFIDLADPAKRTREDLRVGLAMLSKLQSQAEVIFGMNESESIQVADVLGIQLESNEARAAEIRASLDISITCIHPTRSASAASANGAWTIPGPFSEHPVLTTGAGDVFNSGFCHGLIEGLSPFQALACGVGASGFYVRNGESASEAQLIDFMHAWAEAGCVSPY